MSQRARKRGVILLFIGILVVLFVAFGLKTNWQFTGAQLAGAAIPVSADSLNTDNEGRQAPDVVVLVRDVEMFQWQQTCEASDCRLHTTWSSDLIDSARFSERAGHENPHLFPIASDRFVGNGIRLGAFVPDADLLVSSISLKPRAVTLAELSPNLAASFSISDNALFSGDDPEHPVVGDLRIRYSIVAGGEVTVTGIQQSSQLVDPAHARQP